MGKEKVSCGCFNITPAEVIQDEPFDIAESREKGNNDGYPSVVRLATEPKPRVGIPSMVSVGHQASRYCHLAYVGEKPLRGVDFGKVFDIRKGFQTDPAVEYGAATMEPGAAGQGACLKIRPCRRTRAIEHVDETVVYFLGQVRKTA